ncbi:MAG: DUF3791 domain-containing protein [Oscillospiraceae bacterium]|nr:DUF3791 domain-containing protein [Oscillospiraceae bacterium]
MNTEIMEYMVWVIELVASEFFDGSKSLAYNVLNEQGVWELYIQNYDTTHSVGANAIIDEIREILTVKGVL